MKTFRIVAGLIAIAIAAYVWLGPDRGVPTAPDTHGLPWQIQILENGGSRVFGLEPGRSTLDAARMRFGDGMKIGIVAAQGETGALEAYYESVMAGPILGRMILVANLAPDSLAQLRERSVDRTHMNDSTFRYVLAPDDLPVALRAPIAGITFIPAANLDAERVLKRFGAPQERLRVNEHLEHFLYPELGLDLVIDTEGKEVLQYVAPREFARLREPLLRNAAPSPGP